MIMKKLRRTSLQSTIDEISVVCHPPACHRSCWDPYLDDLLLFLMVFHGPGVGFEALLFIWMTNPWAIFGQSVPNLFPMLVPVASFSKGLGTDMHRHVETFQEFWPTTCSFHLFGPPQWCWRGVQRPICLAEPAKGHQSATNLAQWVTTTLGAYQLFEDSLGQEPSQVKGMTPSKLLEGGPTTNLSWQSLEILQSTEL